MLTGKDEDKDIPDQESRDGKLEVGRQIEGNHSYLSAEMRHLDCILKEKSNWALFTLWEK